VPSPQPPNEQTVLKKVAWAASAPRPAGVPERAAADRLPPGQHRAKGWPVLDLGIRPAITRETLELEVDGLVDRPLRLTFADLLALPQTESVSDFHCVTTWSTFDNAWSGVRFRDLMSLAAPRPEARFVLFTSSDGYTTNLPLEACVDEDVLVVHGWMGQPLPPEHGGPVRMIVPKRYGWKSAKWIRKITCLAEDQKGFWEVRGYSNTAFPWQEDRFS
jgi:DMSO/TMAO reductase YedYZ molybdopterin-dependent catalytic subunit